MNKKKIARLMIFIIAVIVASYPLTLAAQGYENLDSDAKHLTTVLLMAIVGGLLFSLRKVKRITPAQLETIETLELLAIVVIPNVEVSSFIIKTSKNSLLAMAPFFVSAIGWYALVNLRHEPFSNLKEESQFNFLTRYMLGVFLFIGSAATWLIVFLLSLSKH